MYNDGLAKDYLKRAGSRLKALEVLMAEESWPDVVQEAQEIVEITPKALLRSCHIEVPRIHDVSPVLDQNRDRLPSQINDQLGELMRISKNLRRDRELAFYGSEDLTPSEFYTGDDAAAALAQARQVYLAVNNVVRLANGKDNRS
jgi:HEPN domain-containing protein